MNPGRELDALIAEKVMGLEPWPTQDLRWGVMAFKAPIVPYGEEPKPCQAPSYSTDISAAWDVVEKLIKDGWEISEAGYSMSTKKWDFTFGNGSSFHGPLCSTAPHAICLAALKAVGVEV